MRPDSSEGHDTTHVGPGGERMETTRPYQFGDPVSEVDILLPDITHVTFAFLFHNPTTDQLTWESIWSHDDEVPQFLPRAIRLTTRTTNDDGEHIDERVYVVEIPTGVLGVAGEDG